MGKILAFDFKAMEYGIACHVWPDAKLREALLSSDVHASVARQMFGPIAEDPAHKKEFRVWAKNISFGTLFGSKGYEVAQQTGLPLAKIQEFIAMFRRTFPDMIEGMETTKQQAIDPGWVTSITGRQRRFYLPKDRRWQKRAEVQAELREALNFPVQGPAAEITLLSMIRVHKWLKHRKFRALVVNNVHDCVVVDSPDSEVDSVVPNVVGLMENPPTHKVWDFRLTVPLKVSVGIGPSWGEAKED